ncbi:UNVERIFIED_CONTAM: hypothetical protein FKN15_008420 [Acipenser sinensis]
MILVMREQVVMGLRVRRMWEPIPRAKENTSKSSSNILCRRDAPGGHLLEVDPGCGRHCGLLLVCVAARVADVTLLSLWQGARTFLQRWLWPYVTEQTV